MAKHVPVGEPVNDSERWAFAFLRDRLPEHYLLLTNVEVHTTTGQPLECDAVVIGDWSVYIVDVKSYRGRLDAGKDIWQLDGHEVENPLPKANHVARVFAGRMRRKAGQGAFVPWCQGMAFITGAAGNDIRVSRGEPEFKVFGPADIISGLMEEQHSTAPKPRLLSQAERTLAERTIGQISLLERRRQRIQNFQKQHLMYKAGLFEIWLAEWSHGDLKLPYLLKLVDAGAAEAPEEWRQLRDDLVWEFRLLQELTGVSGVPYAAPLINTGEVMVLPILRPRGFPLNAVKPAEWDPTLRAETLLAACMSLDAIHARGVTHGNIVPGSIFVEPREVTFLDFRRDGRGSQAADAKALALAFRSWFDGKDEDRFHDVAEWLELAAGTTGDDALPTLTDLRYLLTIALYDGHRPSAPTSAPLLPAPGVEIAGRYRLLEQMEQAGVWRAHHLLGRFDLAVRLIDGAEESFEAAKAEFALLSQLYHPSIVRTFDMGLLDGTDTYFVSQALLPGRTLADWIADGGAPVPDSMLWLRQVVEALEYLHRSGLTHRNITPASVSTEGDRAILSDFSVEPPENRLTGNVRYKAPFVLEDAWTAGADLYAVATVFAEGLMGIHPDDIHGSVRDILLTKAVPAPVAQAIASILDGGGRLIGPAYDALFGLETLDSTIRALPPEFAKRWGISKGYMTFLVLDMLNDRRPRARRQWVLNALRSRNIPGNRTNTGSMSSAVSRLKSSGIAEEHGKKVRLTSAFLADWVGTGEVLHLEAAVT